jgi:hypothetical protein
MRRRQLITLLGGAAATWPLIALAQQGGMPRIGVLMGLAVDDPEAQARLAALFQGLQQLGWTVGQNVRVDCRWAGANADDMRKYAAELVALTPNVILAHSSAAVAPLLQVTRAVPIVFAIVVDPVGALVFGWIYAAHFLSAGLMALAAAETRDLMATYLPAFLAAGLLCLIAVPPLALLRERAGSVALASASP